MGVGGAGGGVGEGEGRGGTGGRKAGHWFWVDGGFWGSTVPVGEIVEVGEGHDK